MRYILSKLPDYIASAISNIDAIILNKITEIRLRRNLPVVIVIRNTSYFLSISGEILDFYSSNALLCDENAFDTCFIELCDYSLYSNMENLKNGFITLSNGSRVGVASTCVIDDLNTISVKDITSLNIRIPREYEGCSEKILNFLYINSFPSIIIAGKPNSGKTTLLRDIARALSSGFNNEYRKIVVVDERNEICGKNSNEISLNVGVNTDVLSSFPKSKGIEIATRALSPEMIICDEISTKKELESIIYAFSSGVRFAVSVHIGDKSELKNKRIIQDLISTGEFAYIAWIDEYSYSVEIIEASDVCA